MPTVSRVSVGVKTFSVAIVVGIGNNAFITDSVLACRVRRAFIIAFPAIRRIFAQIDDIAVAIGSAQADGALSISANLSVWATIVAFQTVINVISNFNNYIAAIGFAHADGALSTFANLAIGASIASRASVNTITNFDNHAIAIGFAHAIGTLSVFANLAIGASIVAA